MRLNSITFTKVGKTMVDCSSVSIVYESKNGLWRGFILPYDVTYEANTKEEVLNVLKDMLSAYEDGLNKYGSPSHLNETILTDDEDVEKFSQIQSDLISRLKRSEWVIEQPAYYAEAQLPA